MEIRNYLNPVINYLIFIFLFFLSSYQQVSVISIVILSVVFIFSGNIIKSVNFIRETKYLFVPIVFYFVHVISLLYSDNLSYGLFDLEVKLTFLIFPILLSGIDISKNDFHNFKIAFVAGIIFSSLICFGNSIIQFTKTNLIDVFYYEAYSYFLHPSYITIYLNLALLIVLHSYFKERLINNNLIHILSIIFLFLNITLLTSRTGIIVTLLTLVLYFVYLFANSKESRKLFPKIALIIFLLIPQLFVLNLYNRFNFVKSEIYIPKNNKSTQKDYPVLPENTSRMALWTNSINLIKENPVLGVGAGDIKDEFAKISANSENKYFNPHNQYLHTAASIGLLGLSILLILLAWPFLSSIRENNIIYLLFIVMIGVHAFTESILERQAGILFFNFFNTLFFIAKFSKSSSDKN